MINLAKILLLLFFKLRMETFLENLFFRKMFFNNIPPQETIDIAIELIFNDNPNLNITKKSLKNFSFLLYQRLILFLTVSFIIKSME